MSGEEKLDWIYKGANSLVDREDYLLGRKVDKSLEQLNEEEKEKKYVLPTPKNHVEHECIPPSIRDFNKIVQAEQVDLSAKLQEDPLVAIKKREEDARRQFLQNPIQLKKLQDALKKKELQKKKHKQSKKRRSGDDLDRQIKEKLKFLKSNTFGIGSSKKKLKKEKDDVLNTILMHKFNALKDKLSEDDINDILNGRVSDTDSNDDKPGKKTKAYVSSESDSEEESKRNSSYVSSYRKQGSSSRSRNLDTKRKKGYTSSDSLETDNRREKNHGPSNCKQRSSRDDGDGRRKHEHRQKKSRSSSSDSNRSNRSRNRDSHVKSERTKSKTYKDRYKSESKQKREDYNDSSQRNANLKTDKITEVKQDSNDEESELDRKIMAKLKMLRGESCPPEAKTENSYQGRPPNVGKSTNNSSSELSDERETKFTFQNEKSDKTTTKKYILPEKPQHLRYSDKSDYSNSDREEKKYRYSDSDDDRPQKKTFGLVTSDGKKIAIKNTEKYKKTDTRSAKKIGHSFKPDRKKNEKMTEEEKDRRRNEMIINAKARDKERSDNVKKYIEKDKKEEEIISKEYNADLVHTKLLKAARISSVEDRIKSNLNNIQRSSAHMNQNFSKR